MKAMVSMNNRRKICATMSKLDYYVEETKSIDANYAQTECQFRYCGTAIPFLTVRSTAR